MLAFCLVTSEESATVTPSVTPRISSISYHKLCSSSLCTMMSIRPGSCTETKRIIAIIGSMMVSL